MSFASSSASESVAPLAGPVVPGVVCPPVCLHQEFWATAARLPGKLALVCDGQRLSYVELAARVRSLSAALRRSGVRRGDRVGLFLDNSVDLVVGVLAVLDCGAAFMPVHAQARADKLAYILSHTEAVALLTQATLAEVWQPVCDGLPHPVHVFVAGTDWPDGDAPAESAPVLDQDLACLIHTSGTTGTPKGVMLTHLNVLSASRSIRAYLGLVESDVMHCALPLVFSYGLSQLFSCFGVGATLVLERSFIFPAKVVEAMARERSTVFAGVPTLYAQLTGLKNLAGYDLGALRLLTNAAAALPVPLVQRLRELLPQARLVLMYGQTECTRISYLPPEELARRPDSVGRGLPNQDLWLVDAQGRRLPPGSTGELVVRGSHVMLGYWRNPEETARKLRPGPLPGQVVLHTGDLFHCDADGWLTFVSRQDDIIKTRGEKVSPREVEDVIYAIPGVHEAAVVGVPDELLGQAVKAYVVLAPDAPPLSERDIIKVCMARLEPFMAPRQVQFVTSLPKTESGKISRLGLGADSSTPGSTSA